MRRVILKNLWAHKMRLVLVSTAITLGVAFVAGSFVLTNTVNATFDDLFSNVYKDTDVVVRGAAPDGAFSDATRAPIDASVVNQVAAVPGVQEAEGSADGFAQLIDKEGGTIGGGGAPALGGTWSDSTNLNPFRLSQGTAPRNDQEVVIDAASAKKAKFSVGDEVKILTTQAPATYRISGIAKFGEVDSPGGATYALFTVAQSQRTFNLEGKFSYISVVGDGNSTQQELRDRIAAQLPGGLAADTGEDITKENQNSVKEGLSFLTTILLVFAGISLFVGAFVINNVFAILVAQRTKELAMLRAIGARGRQVMTAVLAEAFVTGLIASAIGLGVGILLASGVLAAFKAFGVDLSNGSVVIGANAIVAALVCGVVVTLVSAFVPARKAARVPPLAAMRDVAVERTRPTIKRVVFGGLLLVIGGGLIALGLLGDIDKPYIAVGAGAAITFIAINALAPAFSGPVTRALGWPVARLRGVSGKLAQENAARNPRRTSSTASALMIGVALVTMFTVVFSSAKASIDRQVDKAFAGDFIVAGPNTGGGLPVELEGRISQLPQTGVISPQRFTPLLINSSERYGSAVDPRTFSQILDLKVSSGNLADLNETGLAVNKSVAEDRKWTVGQSIDVQFESGAAKPFRLAAIYDEPGPVGDFVVSTAAYDANVTEKFDSSIFIKLKDGVTVDQARASYESLLEAYPNAELQDNEGVKESITSQIDIVLNILYGLLALAVIIALLGIATTLALSVFERTHEIGLLRAVGMSRRQLRSTIRWESIIVSVFGAGLGLVVGIAFALALIASLGNEGFETLALPWTTFVVIVVLAAIAGVLAALWPARRAARLNVLTAIATN